MYPLNSVEDHDASLLNERHVFVRTYDDKRDTFYSISQPSCNFDRPLVFRHIFVAENVDPYRLRPKTKYEIGPMKLTKAAAVHSRLLPLICSSGRRHMSTRAAISSATCIIPENMTPRRCPVLRSLHRFFAIATLLSHRVLVRVNVQCMGPSGLITMNHLAS